MAGRFARGGPADQACRGRFTGVRCARGCAPVHPLSRPAPAQGERERQQRRHPTHARAPRPRGEVALERRHDDSRRTEARRGSRHSCPASAHCASSVHGVRHAPSRHSPGRHHVTPAVQLSPSPASGRCALMHASRAVSHCRPAAQPASHEPVQYGSECCGSRHAAAPLALRGDEAGVEFARAVRVGPRAGLGAAPLVRAAVGRGSRRRRARGTRRCTARRLAHTQSQSTGVQPCRQRPSRGQPASSCVRSQSSMKSR